MVDKLHLHVKEHFVIPYHDDKTAGNKKRLEEKIKVKNNVIVYCPPDHPQAKEIQTFIQTKHKSNEVTTLNQMYGDLTIEKQVKILSREKYKQLWKFFLFLHPDDAKNEIVVCKVIKKFCEEILEGDKGLFETLIWDKDFVKHPKDKPLSKLRLELLEKWQKRRDREILSKIPSLDPFVPDSDSDHSFVYPGIIQKMRSIVSNDSEWEKYETSEFITGEEYYDAFHNLWYQILIKRYEQEGEESFGKLTEFGSSLSYVRDLQHSLVESAIEVQKKSRGVQKRWDAALRDAEKNKIRKIIEGNNERQKAEK